LEGIAEEITAIEEILIVKIDGEIREVRAKELLLDYRNIRYRSQYSRKPFGVAKRYPIPAGLKDFRNQYSNQNQSIERLL